MNLFIGHGSPMNAIENNEYTNAWSELGKLFKPKGILMISAHWVTDGTKVQTVSKPKKIDDMYGFPKALYDLKYPVSGDIDLSHQVMDLVGAEEDNSWGIDHGAWSILVHMYPKADVPVVQMSLDKNLSPKEMFEMGRKLKVLNEKGYSIIGSGNVVHSFKYMNMTEPQPFAVEFDHVIEKYVKANDSDKVINYHLIDDYDKSFQTSEHFDPLIYVLGASEGSEVEVFNRGVEMGAFSMTSYILKRA